MSVDIDVSIDLAEIDPVMVFDDLEMEDFLTPMFADVLDTSLSVVPDDSEVTTIAETELIGNDGMDVFRFDSIPDDGNVSYVNLFKSGEDIIVIESKAFEGLQKGSQVSFDQAVGDDAQMVFDTQYGALFFDKNGAQDGGEQLIAYFVGNNDVGEVIPHVAQSDFLIV